MNEHNLRFGTNQQCHDFLAQLRWKGTPTCPKCGNINMNYYLSTRNVYKCSSCYKQFSVKQGTVFETSKIPLQKWFLAIYFFATKPGGVSSVQMGKWLGVSQKTSWFLLQRLREAAMDENNIILDGVIEADETFVGPDIRKDKRLQYKRKKHYENQELIHGIEKNKARSQRGFAAKNGRKKGSTKEVLTQKKLEREALGERKSFEKDTVVFGMIERGGRLVMKKIGHGKKCINRRTIYPHLAFRATNRSILITDEAIIYDKTIHLFTEHFTINHNQTYVMDDIHTNNIENAWKQLKKTIYGTYGHISKWHFDRYLNENTFRYNRRQESELSKFDSLLQLISGKRITYKSLISRKQNQLAA